MPTIKMPTARELYPLGPLTAKEQRMSATQQAKPKRRVVEALAVFAALVFIPILGIGLTNAPPEQQQTADWGTDLMCHPADGRPDYAMPFGTLAMAEAVRDWPGSTTRCRITHIGKDVPAGYTVLADGTLMSEADLHATAAKHPEWANDPINVGTPEDRERIGRQITAGALKRADR